MSHSCAFPGLSPLVHNDGSVYNRSGSGGAFLANDASELLLEQWLRRPQNQPEFVPTADPFQGISQVMRCIGTSALHEDMIPGDGDSGDACRRTWHTAWPL